LFFLASSSYCYASQSQPATFAQQQSDDVDEEGKQPMMANNLQSQGRTKRRAFISHSPHTPKATNLFAFIYTAMHPPSNFSSNTKRSTSKNK
jgi:hypothetical protein